LFVFAAKGSYFSILIEEESAQNLVHYAL